MSKTEAHNESDLIQLLASFGYKDASQVTKTLQGSLWRARNKSTEKGVVIKVARRELQNAHAAVVEGRYFRTREDIVKETTVLKHLSSDNDSSQRLARYVNDHQSEEYFLLVMEDGGDSLFEFVVKVHRFIEKGLLDVVEWLRLVRILSRQMLDCIAYIHERSACHFDVSCENWLISDISINVDQDNKITFCTDQGVSVKLCDFGLAEIFAPKRENASSLASSCAGDLDNAQHVISFESTKYCGKPTYHSPEVTARQGSFCAKSNDIWCLATCVFMMAVGSAPWVRTRASDECFRHVMNGNVLPLLKSWGRLPFVTAELVAVFNGVFQFEARRLSLAEVGRLAWFAPVDKIDIVSRPSNVKLVLDV